MTCTDFDLSLYLDGHIEAVFAVPERCDLVMAGLPVVTGQSIDELCQAKISAVSGLLLASGMVSDWTPDVAMLPPGATYMKDLCGRTCSQKGVNIGHCQPLPPIPPAPPPSVPPTPQGPPQPPRRPPLFPPPLSPQQPPPVPPISPPASPGLAMVAHDIGELRAAISELLQLQASDPQARVFPIFLPEGHVYPLGGEQLILGDFQASSSLDSRVRIFSVGAGATIDAQGLSRAILLRGKSGSLFELDHIHVGNGRGQFGACISVGISGIPQGEPGLRLFLTDLTVFGCVAGLDTDLRESVQRSQFRVSSESNGSVQSHGTAVRVSRFCELVTNRVRFTNITGRDNLQSLRGSVEVTGGDVTFVNSTFSGILLQSGIFSAGGAIIAIQSNVHILSCLFRDILVRSGVGGIGGAIQVSSPWGEGNGEYNHYTRLTISDSHFEDCSAQGTFRARGGAISLVSWVGFEPHLSRLRLA